MTSLSSSWLVSILYWRTPIMDTDHNLLFGVLALQADLINVAQFAEICTSWTARKDAPLADLLLERGWISQEDRAAIDHLMQLKLKKHRGDAAKSLGAVANDEVRRALAALEIDDPEIRQSLETLTRQGGHVVVSTLTYQPETRERYTLTRLHATGGIGQVWLARDIDLGREVALKELRPERTAHPEVRTRFLDEAKITGQLEHPGIVPIYELSRRSNDQQPFYTMRFVKGQTLTEAVLGYHRRRQEGTEQPLDLRNLIVAFVGACNAVAYAHSRGVIHRDLKGQNIILGDFGEVIVLDWGLAKVIGQTEGGGGPASPPPAVGDERTPTVQGQVLGTPAYMAPEQAEGRLDAVDHRSDVYGLGAILYEILTGKAPFTGGSTDEVLRKVREEPPRRPRELCPGTPPALEAICLKAMAKRPETRYPTAIDVAREIQRFLADEPVEAWREPWTIRLGRWARRHRTTVTAAAAVLVVATGAMAASNLLIRREQARTETERRRAEQNFQQAFGAVDRYYTLVSESKLLTVPGLQPLRKELLQTALEYYRTFADQRGDDPRVRSELGRALQRQANITASIESLDRAIELARQAIAIFNRLTRDQPGNRQYQRDLAVSHANLGYWLAGTGQPDHAETAFQSARDIFEELSREQPQNTQYQRDLAKLHNNRGLLYLSLGAIPRAEEAHRQALAIRESLAAAHPHDLEIQNDLGETLGNLANVALALRQAGPAEDSYKKAQAIFEKLAEDHPEVLSYAISAASTQVGLGMLYRQTGRASEAESTLRVALRVRQRLADQNPTVADYQHNVALIHGTLGEVLSQMGRTDEAETAYEQARAIWETLVERQPEISQYQRDLAATHGALAELYRATERLDQAETSYQQARELCEALVRDQPNVLAHRVDLAKLRANLGEILARLRRTREAEESLQSALSLWNILLTQQPGQPTLESGLAWTSNALGKLYQAAGKHDQAADAYDRALTIHERLATTHPEQLEFALYQGETLANKGSLFRDAGQMTEAISCYNQAIQTFENLLQREPRYEAARADLTRARAERAQLRATLDRVPEATQDRRQP
jgi:serine/threonine-protein kinase